MKSEWLAVLKERKIVVPLIALLFIPVLYSAMLLWAFWDPYDKLGELPVAVVNEDKGALVADQDINVGEEMIDKLKENDNFLWEFVSYDEAMKGFKERHYYLMVRIPENFSEQAGTMGDDEPKKAVIEYLPNESLNFLSAQIGETAIEKLKAEVSEQLTKTYAETIFDGISELQSGLVEASEGAEKIADGTIEAKDGADQLAKHLMTLANKSGELNSGMQQANKGYSQLYEGIHELNRGSNELLNRLKEKSANVNQLTNGGKELQTGADRLATGLLQLDNGFVQLQNGAEQSKQGTSQLIAGQAELTAGMTQFSSKLKEAKTGSEQLATGTTAMNDGISTFAQGWGQAVGGVAQLVEGENQLIHGGNELASGLGHLAIGTEALNEGATELADGTKSLQGGIDKLTDGTKELATKLADGAKEANQVGGKDSLSDFIASPVVIKETKLQEVPNYGTGITPYFLSLGLFVGALMLTIVYPLREPLAQPKSAWHWFISKFSIMAVVGVIQAIIAASIILFALNIEVTNGFYFYLFAVFTSLTFVALIQFLVTLFGDPGRFIAIILLILQLTTSAGTYPIELIPDALQVFHAWLPMTYSVSGFKAVISSGDMAFMWKNSQFLIGLTVLLSGLTFGYFHYRFKRTYANFVKE